MTYRTMHGLGDTQTLTPEQIGLLLKAVNSAGGCTPTLKSNLQNLPCLNMQLIQVIGSCVAGVTPPGISDAEFAAACSAFAACGAFSKIGCAADGAALLAQVPSCLAPSDRTAVDYCRTNGKPNGTFEGPDASANTMCWAISRFPDVYTKIMTAPACAAQPSSPPSAPPVTPVTAAPAQAGMSTGGMVAIGAGAVAVLGIGYLLLKKK